MKIETTLLAAAFAVSLGFGGCAGGEVNRKMKDYHGMIMKRFDVDHDAKLSDDELKAYRTETLAGRFPAPPEFSKVPSELKIFDLDKDGKLNLAERVALTYDVEGGRFKPQGSPGPEGEGKPPPEPGMDRPGGGETPAQDLLDRY